MWKSGRATLTEIENHWSISDLWTANLVLDLEEDAQIEAENRIPEPTKGKRK